MYFKIFTISSFFGVLFMVWLDKTHLGDCSGRADWCTISNITYAKNFLSIVLIFEIQLG